MASGSQPCNLVDSCLEIRARDCKPLGSRVVVPTLIADELLDPPHCRPLAYRGNVGSREALGAPGQLGEHYVIVQRDLGRVNLKHLLPLVLVQLPELDDESELTRRLVAPRTITSLSSVRVSNSLRNWLTIRSVLPPSTPPRRVGTIASISSKRRMHGAASFAFRNTCRSAFSDSPTHLEKIMAASAAMNDSPLSAASALAISVLPVPDAPLSITPFGGRMPVRANSLGALRGNSMIASSCRRTSSSPPTSAQLVLGRSTKNSRVAVGSICLRASRK